MSISPEHSKTTARGLASPAAKYNIPGGVGNQVRTEYYLYNTSLGKCMYKAATRVAASTPPPQAPRYIQGSSP